MKLQVLEEARSRDGLDYKDLAEKTGLTPLSVRNALQAKTALRATNLMALADVLGLEMVLVPKAMASSLNASQNSPGGFKVASYGGPNHQPGTNVASSNLERVGNTVQGNRPLFVPMMERVLQATSQPIPKTGRSPRKS